VGQSHNINIVDKFFESVAKFRYSATTLINQRAFMKKLSEDLTLGMPVTIRRRIIILSLFFPKTESLKYTERYICRLFCGSETCSLTLGEEHGLRVFENGVQRKIFGPKRDKVRGLEETAQ